MLERDPTLWFSVSVTDRERRPEEVDGRDYRFVSSEDFERLRDAGGLLESFEVYGDLKGTPRAPIEEHLAAGDDVLVEVDVNGALAIREAFPQAYLVFVRPPSRAVQERRLRARAEEDAERSGEALDEAGLRRRLDEAAAEEAASARFDEVVVNDDLERALDEVETLLAARRRR